MRLLISLSLLIVLASCGGSAVRRELSRADSLVVTFDSTTAGGPKSVSTTESKAIRKVAGFMAAKETTKQSCPPDGNITFYKEGKLIVAAVFNYTSDTCRYFFFDLGNTVHTTKMSNEARDFFTELKENR